MALDDYLESEVGIAVAATAVIFSPQVRSWLRRGIVYGLAGALKAGDVLASGARTVASEAQKSGLPGAATVKETTQDAQAVARGNKAGRATQAE